jgi:hypothetical protein
MDERNSYKHTSMVFFEKVVLNLPRSIAHSVTEGQAKLEKLKRAYFPMEINISGCVFFTVFKSSATAC